MLGVRTGRNRRVWGGAVGGGGGGVGGWESMTGQLPTSPPLIGLNKGSLSSLVLRTATSQEDPPQVSRWGDGVTLWTQLLCSLKRKKNKPFIKHALVISLYIRVIINKLIIEINQHKCDVLPAFEANTPHSEHASTGWRWEGLCTCPVEREHMQVMRSLYLQC